MRLPTLRTTVAAVVLAAVGAAGAGCSGQAVLSQAQAEKQISAALEKEVGQKPDKVTCPGDVDAEKGKTMKCELTADGTTYGLTITITSVKDDNVKFDIKVDSTPKN
jgi:hypothetical protein